LRGRSAAPRCGASHVHDGGAGTPAPILFGGARPRRSGASNRAGRAPGVRAFRTCARSPVANDPRVPALWSPPGAPLGEKPPGRLRFLGSLLDLVALGLHRPALDALAAGPGAVPAPPVDRAYLLKILNEEISRPFGHPLR